VRRVLFDAEPEVFDRLEESVFSAILQTRQLLHIHSERIYVMGCGEGAAVAYWLGLTYPERFAGIVAINGWLPVGLRPLSRVRACRGLPILAVHGAWNSRAPLHEARRDVATLRAGGLGVAFQTYPCAHRLTSPMLADVDNWLIGHCTGEVGF
jgi:phospholipase/carboxylesterase